MEIWRKPIIVTQISRTHMIARESSVVYIMVCWMIEFRKSYSQEWFRMYIIFLRPEEISIDKVAS